MVIRTFHPAFLAASSDLYIGTELHRSGIARTTKLSRVITALAYANFEIRGGKAIRNVEAEIVPVRSPLY